MRGGNALLVNRWEGHSGARLWIRLLWTAWKLFSPALGARPRKEGGAKQF